MPAPSLLGALQLAHSAASKFVRANKAIYSTLGPDANTTRAWQDGAAALERAFEKGGSIDRVKALRKEAVAFRKDLRQMLMDRGFSKKEANKLIKTDPRFKDAYRSDLAQAEREAGTDLWNGTMGRGLKTAREYYFGRNKASTLAARWGATGVAYLGAAGAVRAIVPGGGGFITENGRTDIAGVPFI